MGKLKELLDEMQCLICYAPDRETVNKQIMQMHYIQEHISNLVEAPVKPVDYGTCKNCIFNLEESETSLSSECQLTVDEFTGIGVMFSRDFGCNQWQSKPSV